MMSSGSEAAIAVCWSRLFEAYDFNFGKCFTKAKSLKSESCVHTVVLHCIAVVNIVPSAIGILRSELVLQPELRVQN